MNGNGVELPRPALLVSVRSPAEAADALAGGADVIDVKEPAAGSLGPATAATCCGIAEIVGERAPWTMACGELADGSERIGDLLASTWEALAASGSATVRLPAAIKVGLAGCAERPWQRELARLADGLPPGVGQVAVLYADAERCGAPLPIEVLAAVSDLRPAAVLVDTFDKQAAGLLGQRTVEELKRWRETAAAAGCRFVLAGKLTVEMFASLAEVDADIIAVRSAVCSQGRSGPVDPALVRRVRASLLRPPAGAPR